MKQIDGFELLPCPFCGKEPKAFKIVEEDEVDYYVECETMGCPAELSTADIKYWNKRACKNG